MTLTDTPSRPVEVDEAELLFREARQRRRRRWLVAGMIFVAAAGVIFAVVDPGAKIEVRPPVSPPRTPPPLAVSGAAVLPQVAWVDNEGQLHIGDISGFTQRAVAQADADPTAPLVTAGGWVFWVRSQQLNANGSVRPIPNPKVFGFDTATGQTEQIGPGTQVIASVDQSFIYVETDSRHLTEYWLDGTHKGRTLPLPDGWFLLNSSGNSDPTPVIADGILVVSTAYPHTTQTGGDGTLAVWNPSDGRVRALGKAWEVSATYTAPGARSSLVAWYPASCGTSKSCTLSITNTANYSSRSVTSPIGHFLWGGGFSPDGSRLAVFANSRYMPGSPTAQLAVVDTRSGSLKLVKGVYVYVGDSVHWAAWLPNGRHLITGGLGGPFGSNAPAVDVLVDSQTLQVSPFRFITDRNQDLTISTVTVK
jgi:hypothetical protein